MPAVPINLPTRPASDDPQTVSARRLGRRSGEIIVTHADRSLIVSNTPTHCENELKALDWLSDYVKHAGRYPIPTKAKDLEAPIGFGFDAKLFKDGSVKVHSTDQDNLKAAEALVTKLLE